MAAAGVMDFSLQVNLVLCFSTLIGVQLSLVALCCYLLANKRLMLFCKLDLHNGSQCWLQDICKPEPARLRRNLSAVINFAKFREEKLVPYTEMQEKAIGLMEEAEQLEESNRALVSLTCKCSSASKIPVPCFSCSRCAH